MPEIRRRQGKSGTGPGRPDFGARNVRRGISSQGVRPRDPPASFGFADDLRPPGTIGNQPRWPISPAPTTTAPQGNYQGGYSDSALRQPNYAPPSNGPISLSAPGVAPQEDEIELPPEAAPGQAPYRNAPAYPPRDRYAAPFQAPYAEPYSQAPRVRAAAARTRARQCPSARSVRSRSSRRRRWPVRSFRCSTAGSLTPCSRRPALVRRARGRDQADLRLFLPRHERQFECAYFRTRLRQRARCRGLRARRRPPRHGEGRLERHAGRAGFSGATSRAPPACCSTPCWRRAPTSTTTTTFTWT